MNSTRVGVDLAKKVIQVCVYKNKKVQSNKELTPEEFTLWLSNSNPCTIVFEACATSNYWKQKATESGHDARIISAKLVKAVRQNQKTDKNDALAIIQAAQLPDVEFVSGKSKEQQYLQSIKRMRELAVRQRDALKSQLVALLTELNFRIPNNESGIVTTTDNLLEDVENEFSDEFRAALNVAKAQLVMHIDAVKKYDQCLESSIEFHPDCKKLLKLEGVGPVNAINLFIALGCSESSSFRKGKDAAACIGLTPVQHSSGGKVKLGSIGKHTKDTIMRSQLITGAMASVQYIAKRPAKTKKEAWLQGIISRRGKKCAAVALANKNVRTAFAMLTQGTEYKAELLSV